MGTKNGFSNAQILAIVGGIISIISVFLPWFSAKASALGMISSISVNGLGSVSGSGLLLGLLSGKGSWEFQGIGILALGIVCIAVAVFLREKLQSIAMFICGALIIGGGVVNIRSIGEFSGSFLGAEMQSGAGYGLYVVVLAGAMAAAGGVLAWNDIQK
jgi:lipoprotein signal peptidase